MTKGFKISVADYCENCKEFVPEHRSDTYGNNMSGFKTYTTVYCKNAAICRRLYGHIKNKMEEEFNV